MYPSANAATPYIFPPPLNTTFTTAFWNSPLRRKSTKNETDNLLRSAAYDLPRPLWGIGSDLSELHAGDKIYAKWEGDNLINLAWYCLMCTLEVETGDVWGACENYTKSVSTFMTTAPNHGPLAGPIIAPSFSKWNTPILPEETCGLCFLTQFEDHLGWANTGYTIPFPVFAASRTLTSSSKQFRDFSTDYPAGRLLSYFPTVTSIPKTHRIEARQRGGSRKISPERQRAGMISGLSFFGVAVLLIALWKMYKLKMILNAKKWAKARERARIRERERVRASANSVEMDSTRAIEESGVERRPDSIVSEPPPAYHEIVYHGGRGRGELGN